MLGSRLVLHHRCCRFAERYGCGRCRSYLWRIGCRAIFLLHRSVTQALAPNVRHTLLPGLRPTVITNRVPQRQHGIDARTAPMHARTLQPRFHNHFVGTLDHPTANRPARRLKGWIVHLCHPLLQIGQILGHHWERELRAGETAQVVKHTRGIVMFELV